VTAVAIDTKKAFVKMDIDENVYIDVFKNMSFRGTSG